MILEEKVRGKLFSADLMKEVRSRFHHIENDPLRPGKRLYFDNAGGAFRLKKALSKFNDIDSMPDCPERVHQTALYMNEIMDKAVDDIRVIFNARKEGQIITMLTASQVIWALTGTIVENVPGKNVVTTNLEHPSAFDAAVFYAQKTGKEIRAANTNSTTGGVDPEAIASLVDEDTCLLSVILASNISGVNRYRPAFAIREGGRTVGAGVVGKILE